MNINVTARQLEWQTLEFGLLIWERCPLCYGPGLSAIEASKTLRLLFM